MESCSTGLERLENEVNENARLNLVASEVLQTLGKSLESCPRLHQESKCAASKKLCLWLAHLTVGEAIICPVLLFIAMWSAC